MERQFQFWGDDDDVKTQREQPKPVEGNPDPETGIDGLQATTKQCAWKLFTNPDRQTGFSGLPHHDWPKPDHDRSTITVDRLRNDIDGPSHRFIIRRHDFVEVFAGTNKIGYGRVVGISHAREEVRVLFGEGKEGIWFSVSCIYPAVQPNTDKVKPCVSRSKEIEALAESGSAVEKVRGRIHNQREYTSLKCVALVRTGLMEGRPRLTGTVEAKAFFLRYWQEHPGHDQERFVVACLDTKHRVQSVVVVTVGTLDATLVHPREVFKPAIIEGSSAVCLSHNHPSGDCTPSREDREVTARLSEAGKVLGITVLDHIIVGEGTNAAVSIREC